jgi:two-component system NtrC family sensor kinase
MKSAAAKTPGSTTPAVLIVDDVPANLVALEALLDGLECEVVRATSGDEALRLLLRTPFALVLLDVQMPDMDGFEVAQHIRLNPTTREVPIIFLTAQHLQDNAMRGYESGAVDFLFKPLNPYVLRSKVRVFLELHASRTELSLAYDELQATQARLVQAAKMASLGELVAGVAHELNNPLAFLVSHLDTVRKKLGQFRSELEEPTTPTATAAWDKVLTRLGEMGIGLERIRELVVKLRTFSRLDEGQRKQILVHECIDSVLTILQHRLCGIEVHVDVEESEVLECYPALLNQALLNLISNSIDAISPPGEIRVTAGRRQAGFVLQVEDTGPGIPSEIMDRVVEPFFTTKGVGEGTGLGLSITYSIVKKHQGTLAFENLSDGRGTRASITLPL